MSKDPRPTWPIFVGVAAACVVSATVWVARDMTRQDESFVVAQLDSLVVARNLATAHLKQEKMTSDTRRYLAVSRALPRLDFAPIAMRHPDGRAFELIGARHGSFDGDVAAQLRVRAPRSDTATLFEVRWRAKHASLVGQSLNVRGVHVRFWRQDDVLMALASSGG